MSNANSGQTRVKDIFPLLKKAEEAFEKKNIQEAKRLINLIQEIDPEWDRLVELHKKIEVYELFEATKNQLYSAYLPSDFDSAVLYLRRILDIDPNSAKARQYLRLTEVLSEFYEALDHEGVFKAAQLLERRSQDELIQQLEIDLLQENLNNIRAIRKEITYVEKEIREGNLANAAEITKGLSRKTDMQFVQVKLENSTRILSDIHKDLERNAFDRALDRISSIRRNSGETIFSEEALSNLISFVNHIATAHQKIVNEVSKGDIENATQIYRNMAPVAKMDNVWGDVISDQRKISTLLGQGLFDEVAEIYQKTIDYVKRFSNDIQGIQDNLRKVLKQKEQSKSIQDAINNNDYSQAIELIGELETLAGKNPYTKGLREQVVDAREFERAITDRLVDASNYYQQKEYQKVIDTVNKVLVFRPDNSQALNFLKLAKQALLTKGDVVSITFLRSPLLEKQPLTTEYISEEITPYISAVYELQWILDEMQNREPKERNIRAITHNSPISFSLDGAADALRLVLSLFSKWRREHERKMARLREQEKQLEIERSKAEINEMRANAKNNRFMAKKLISELEKEQEEIRQLRLQNEKMRMELAEERIRLVDQVIDQVAPNLPRDLRLTYMAKLVPHIDTILFSEVEAN